MIILSVISTLYNLFIRSLIGAAPSKLWVQFDHSAAAAGSPPAALDFSYCSWMNLAEEET
jgi:hypothetical protein